MKTVYRQDGSAVELSDDDAARWLKLGLATPAPAKPATPPLDKPVNGLTADKGALA